MLRSRVGWRSSLLVAVLCAAASLWTSSADALPSFAGQTGAPCSACHVGGFGPQLTAFGIYFKATGYTLGGGTGPWSHVPVNIQFEPTSTTLATARPKPPSQGWGTNNFVGPGCASFLLAAGGKIANSDVSVGGILKMWANLNNAVVTNTGQILSLGPSDVKFTNSTPITMGTHSLVLGLDWNDKATEGDPYNDLYGYAFPYIGTTNGVSTNASLMMSKLGLTNGLTVFGFLDNTWYLQAGVYESLSSSQVIAVGKSTTSIGYVVNGAPYVRLAYQHPFGKSFLELGGEYFNVPLQQVPGVVNATLQNTFNDWGLDATYQYTSGKNLVAVASNLLYEQQTLGATYGAGRSTYPTDYLTQFRLAASYYRDNTYGFTIAYNAVTGTSDPKLYPAAALTGSINGSPNSQAIVLQLDWTPYGNSTTHPGYPWLNMRFGVQYTYYLLFNGGTTNYDGSGRNATDNNAFLVFAWFSF